MKKFLSSLANFFRESDKVLIMLCLASSVYGMFLIYSATRSGGSIRQTMVQLGAVVVGLIIAMLLSSVDYEELARLWPIIVVPSVGLMILTYFIGVGPEGSDNRAWLELPGGMSFQPAEVLKFAFILTFAYHVDRMGDRLSHPLNVLLMCIHGAVPIMLVLIQHDTGTATVFAAMFVCMFFASGVKLRYCALGGALVAIGAPLLWKYYFSDFQRERFLVVYDPDTYDPTHLGIFFQQDQGRIALGSGQFWGRGYLQGPRVQGERVPMAYNDFIFSTAGEELGFVGCALIILLIVAIALRILHDADRSRTSMGKMICVGVFAQIVFQAILNIGMVLCLLPVIGVTLPFFSAGGTSVMSLMITMGLVFSVYRHNQKRMSFLDRA